MTGLQTFAKTFGSFLKLTDVVITAAQQITDADLEDQFSDDGSGCGSVFGEMLCDHDLDENEHFVAMKFFEHCAALEKLTIVHTDCVTPWHPTRGSEGVLETVHTASDAYEMWQTYDDEWFPTLFTFPRRANICDESFDPPSYGDESREAVEYRVGGVPPYS